MLFIQANIECYAGWQIGILIYICICVVPIAFVLAHLPFYVKDGKMSVRTFILACLFPLPTVIGYHAMRTWKKQYGASAFSNRGKNDNIEMFDMTFEEKTGPNVTEIEVEKVRKINKYPVEKGSASYNGAVVECLLKHYKYLNLFGIKFTWLGVHMLYRLALVACRTFITEPVTRLYPMSALVLAMTAANAIIRPYKDQRANAAATLSYIANLCIAGLNLVKAHLVAFACDTSFPFKDTVIQYMGIFEEALLVYLPLAATGLWVVCSGLQKFLKKCHIFLC